MNLTVHGKTDVGLVRKGNEDAFVVTDLSSGSAISGPLARIAVGPKGVLLAVSDGMGGRQAGEVASALVLETLVRSMANDATGEMASAPQGIMEAAVGHANREVWEAAKEPGKEHMGATLTAVLVEGTSVHIAEVGDSRAYLLRGGALVQLTSDQSYVQILVDAGVMTAEEAANAPMKNIILQAMGQKEGISVALSKLSLRQRDCILLCSDGLTNKVSPDEMRRIILSAPTMEVACDRLVDLANAKGGEDNITVVLGGVSGGDLPPLVPGEDPASTFEILKSFSAPVVH
jgi:PPM family protein phosphatase